MIDLERREVSWCAAQRAELSETECAILAFLVAHRKRAVSRDELQRVSQEVYRQLQG